MDYFKLHGNCVIVKGANKALIYDLFKARTAGISPNLAELYESEFKIHPYQEVLERYASWKDQLKQFTEHLVENDFAFFTDEPDSFPQVDTTYRFKKRFYSAVIELNSSLLDKYAELFDNLLALDCTVFYLIIRENITDHEELKNLLYLFKESRATCVEVLMDQPYLSFEELEHVTHDMRISYKIFNAPKDEEIKGRWWLKDSLYKFTIIEYYTRPLDLNTKTKYKLDQFSPSLDIYNESQDHNPFFNLKVCIDKEGNYKNDLSFVKSFGKFQTKPLENLLEDKEFKKLWFSSNKKIEKCKDCQHRFQCISNSDIKEVDGKFYKVDLCNYDPYTDTWTTTDKTESESAETN